MTIPVKRRTTTLLCCGFFGISFILELLKQTYIPSLWNTLYNGVYNGVVWLPTSPEQVHQRFSSADTHVEISLLGIANLDDVRSRKHKPIMERRGPFVFQKKRTRVNIEWTDDEDAVMFIQGDEYTFVESASVGKLNDTVVTLNIPLLGVVETILHRYPSGKVSEILQMVAHAVESWGDEGVSGIFMRRQIGELLFGYTDHVLSLLSHIIPGIKSRFSLLDGQGQQSFKMKTGKNVLEEVGDIISWQGVQDIKAWAEPEHVAGTDGSQFSPSIVRESSMDDMYNTTRRVWVAEAYRSFEMVPSHDTRIDGVEVVRLVPSEQSFKASRKYYQMYNGLLNITSPVHDGFTAGSSGGGPKLYLSLPGFCQVDPAVSGTVEGMMCNSNKEGDPHIYLDIGM